MIQNKVFPTLFNPTKANEEMRQRLVFEALEKDCPKSFRYAFSKEDKKNPRLWQKVYEKRCFNILSDPWTAKQKPLPNEINEEYPSLKIPLWWEMFKKKKLDISDIHKNFEFLKKYNIDIYQKDHFENTLAAQLLGDYSYQTLYHFLVYTNYDVNHKIRYGGTLAHSLGFLEGHRYYAFLKETKYVESVVDLILKEADFTLENDEGMTPIDRYCFRTTSPKYLLEKIYPKYITKKHKASLFVRGKSESDSATKAKNLYHNKEICFGEYLVFKKVFDENGVLILIEQATFFDDKDKGNNYITLTDLQKNYKQRDDVHSASTIYTKI